MAEVPVPPEVLKFDTESISPIPPGGYLCATKEVSDAPSTVKVPSGV